MAKNGSRRSARGRGATSNSAGSGAASAARATSKSQSPSPSPSRRWLLAVTVGVILLAVVAGGVVLASRPGDATSVTAGGASNGTVIEANGGHWTNITPDTLASMMERKDFTLLNVKTPYVGEIRGTDLYIPYDQLAARASELPADRAARIVVYCRTGHESAIAAQTLLDLGYTDIENLDGGMTAWTASGRPLVQLNRS